MLHIDTIRNTGRSTDRRYGLSRYATKEVVTACIVRNTSSAARPGGLGASPHKH